MQKTNLEEIKNKVDIVDVVSTYIKLEKSGNQFKARCPFHNEKSPSFYVSSDKNFYHCFGCGVHGDIFTFVMNIERIDFKDALKMMADKAGISLQNYQKEESVDTFSILEDATVFFQKNLVNNFEATSYIQKRGISPQTAQEFRIGFALNDWRSLYSYLQKKGYSDENILESGLCIKHEKGLYDRFRSRIMFPIANSSGKVVAFTGRIIGAESQKEGVAKYVNSPETNIYHKSSILFAYDKAKKEIARSKKIILVEGQMDAVLSHQAGITNTVALSGTALTESHIQIIKRFAETLILALDTDKAGFEAMKKSAAIALFHELEVQALYLEDAKDPADIILENPNTWKEIVEKPISVIAFLTKSILEQESDIDPIKKINRLKKEIFPLLLSVKSPLILDVYISEIAKIMSLNKQDISQELKNFLPAENFSLPVKNENNFSKKEKDFQGLLLKAFVAVEYFLQDQILREKYESFLNQTISSYSDFEFSAFDFLQNTDLKNTESIILEKEFFEKNISPEDKKIYLQEICFIALKTFLEEIRSYYNKKNKESFSEEIFKKITTINQTISNLKNDIEKLN